LLGCSSGENIANRPGDPQNQEFLSLPVLLKTTASLTDIIDMVHSRATTPAREKTPSRDSGNRSQFCALTGLPLAEVSCLQSGAYLPATCDANGNKHPHIFCTKSGNFLGEFCPITGKNKAHATTPCGKLIAKIWDHEKKKLIPHKYCTQSGNNLKASSDPGPRRASSLTKISDSSINKAKSSAGRTHHSALGPRSPIKHTVTKNPAVKNGKTAKPATAASRRPARTKKEPVRLVDETTAGHPAVKKTKAAAPKKSAAKTGAGVKKPAVKKAAPKKAAATPKKPAPKKLAAKKPVPKKPVTKKPVAKKPAAKKPGVKKPAAKKSTGVEKAAAKPEANTKKKVVPKKK
jgi:hypothetical protein